MSKEKNVVHYELDKMEQEVIRILALVRERDCTTGKMGQMMKLIDPEMTELKADVYLHRLQDRGLIGLVLNMGSGPSHWILHRIGKEYAVLHGLDKKL